MSADPKDQTRDEAFWDVHDVAAYLKVSENWVYLQASKGRLPSRKLGGLVRFKPSEVRAFAEDAKPVSAALFSLSKTRP